MGRLDIDEAAELLTDGRLTDRPVELRHGTNSLTVTAAELGVMVDTELALANAAERPSLVSQPIRWIGSLFENRSFDVSYMIDVDVLAEVVSGSDSIFDLDFGLPQLELVNGRFVEADTASLPIVDTDELRDRVLDAAVSGGNGTAVIEIPIAGSETIDRGADELIAEAHHLTKNGIALRVPGVTIQRRISQSALRSWLVFGGTIDEPTISLDEQLAQSTVETLFIDYGDAGDEPTFTVDPPAAFVLSAPPLAQSAAPSTRLSESWRGWKQASGSLNSDHERIPMSGHRMGQVARHRRGDRRVHDQLPAEPDPEHQHPAHRRAHPGGGHRARWRVLDQ